MLPPLSGSGSFGIVGVVRTRHYVYFALKSEVRTGAEMGKRIGLAADRVRVRGSMVPSDPRPHTWEIIANEPELRVDEQIARVMDRIRPYQHAIRDCVSIEPCKATLNASRLWLDTTREGPGFHHPVGWHLSADVMAFLLDVGAELKVREYGP